MPTAMDTVRHTCVLLLTFTLGCLAGGPVARADDSDAPPGPFNPPVLVEASANPLPDAVGTALPSAQPDYLKHVPQALAEARMAINHCQDEYLLGNMKSHVRLVACINPGITAAYQRIGYPYMDIVGEIGAKRIAIAQAIDRKTITDQQGEAELGAFMQRMAEEERKRNSDPYYQQTQQQRD